MANFTFDAYSKREAERTTGKKDFKVTFFNGLKDDGDEIIVRFAYESPRDFDLNTVHRVKGKLNDGKEIYKSISCLREATDPLSKCPLCEKGEKIASKFFVKFLEYTKDEAGNVVHHAKVWERPANFARALVSKVEEAIEMGVYAPGTPISNIVFKIKRRGVKGSLQTTYDIIPTNPIVFKPEVYVPDFSDFADYKVAGSAYLEKSFDEINTFLVDGILFPKKEHSETTTSAYAPVNQAPISTPTYTAPAYTAPVNTTPVYSAPVNPAPVAANPTDNRPKRFTFPN